MAAIDPVVYRSVRAAFDDAQAAAQARPTLLSAADIEILLALSWAGPFRTKHLQHLLDHTLTSPHMTAKRLWALEQAGLIAGRVVYKKPADHPRTTTARRVGKCYTVTELGRTCIVGHDREPYRDKAPQDRVVLAEHDGWVSTTIVHLITQARPILSAVGAFREMRIDAEQTRPIADCVIWLRSRGTPVVEPVIHWSRQFRQRDEEMYLFAVEVDRGTEDVSVISAKAKSYQDTSRNTAFLEHYAGEMPVPLWVAPTDRRMQAIHARWVDVWPHGTWWLTTEEELRKDIFYEYARQQVTQRPFLDPAWAAAVQAAQRLLEETAQTGRAAHGGGSTCNV